MTAAESRYAWHLELRKRAGEITWYAFEAVKLRLADNTTYTPDFAVRTADGYLQMHEVKGGYGWTDDARVKIKVAAELFPFEFLAFVENRKTGGWDIEGF